MKCSLLIWLFPFIVLLLGCADTDKQVADSRTPFECVNPFIGTGGHGHTYPGATLPFGMVQLSPDTRLTGWDGCSGYHFTDSLIYGFSHTHLSGTGVSDYGDILLMPAIGKVHFSNGSDGEAGYRSYFKKETEKAMPGFYAVRLEDSGVEVELTATERAGFHKYRYADPSDARVMLDLTHRDEVISSGLQWISPTEIAGYRISSAWARKQHVYFVAQFSHPITQIVLDSLGDLSQNDGMVVNEHLIASMNFDMESDNVLLVKVGISAVDIEGARKNLSAEIPEWDFEKIREAATTAWTKQLNKVEVEGSKEVREIYYTALYHNSLAPNIFQDVDKRYRGVDGEVHQAENHLQHTVFSLWDTYRATHPWFTLFEREKTVDLIETMLAQFEQRGELPVWELAGNETYCMIGYHSVSVIADAWAKGIQGFDAQRALQAMVTSAENDKFNKQAYEAAGFLASDVEHESVSKTLEYAYDDWCIASMAESIGDMEVADRFFGRAQSYKNLYDPETGYMRAKRGNTWVVPFDPAEVSFHYTEANSWQYSFYMPHDISGWLQLVGGREKMVERLDALFTANSETSGREQPDITGLIGQYAHGNEPSHHMAYLYAFAGQPWKGQFRLHEIMDQLYHAAPDGLSGNEDCGQMSAWYNFSALGFYPVTPGLPMYVIGSPKVSGARLHFENGNTFVIKVSGSGPYIQSMKLNGQSYTQMYIEHDKILSGGEMVFVMGEEPNKELGTAIDDMPVTKIERNNITPVPAIRSKRPAFFTNDTIIIDHPRQDVAIYYTIDGSEPTPADAIRYETPILLDQTTTIKAVAVDPKTGNSKVIEAVISKIPEKRHLTLANDYSTQYPAGGEHALIDYIQGGDDYRSGDWQGYHGVDLDATIDLGKVSELTEIGIRFLQDENSWIFLPEGVRFYLSTDGKSYDELPRQTHSISPYQQGTHQHYFSVKNPGKARFFRLVGENRGICPPNHKGEGGKAWVFADEIIIKERE